MSVIVGSDGRPYTDGKLTGEDAQGNRLVVSKRFLIDTGAQISAIDEDNARLFRKSRLIGVGASGAGGEPLVIYDGITMQFTRMKVNGSDDEEVSCHLFFAVVRRAYCILGVDQLLETKTDFILHLSKRAGELRASPD